MKLCNDLIRLKNSRDGFWFTFGDFNAVRSEYVDVKLRGRKFTRISSNGLKLSKIDRFLVSSDVINREPSYSRPEFFSSKFKRLSFDQCLAIERPFCDEEIKKAIWECGDDKAPGPDGMTFEFVKHFWDIVGIDFRNIVKHFGTSASLTKGCNPSFISLIPKGADPTTPKEYRPISLIGCQYKVIVKLLANSFTLVLLSIISNTQSAYIKGRQIIDGPLIVNKLISWSKKHKSKLMIFKVNFEKEFDSIHWSFLDNVMIWMGFSFIWNFFLKRGLRQGDPLSPFLFLVVAKALHVVMEEENEKNIFRGIRVAQNYNTISHLQFADDVLFVGGTNPHDYESTNNSCWKSIVKAGMEIQDMGFHFFEAFSRKLGRGSSMYFWTEPWLGNHILSKNLRGCLHLKRHMNVVLVIDVEVMMITFNGYGIGVDPSKVEGRWQNSTSLWNYFVTFVMVQVKTVGTSC
uniref:Cysteine-rich receptor-like protein kinase n=1 Tax=Tanacetum cinerariifolium TaxID=118510 RepID=A0A6L2NYQ5_TANCI|nr:cysteine-rich receptor-like protein kinase [Tanacetum cinerariifolium]